MYGIHYSWGYVIHCDTGTLEAVLTIEGGVGREIVRCELTTHILCLGIGWSYLWLVHELIEMESKWTYRGHS